MRSGLGGRFLGIQLSESGVRELADALNSAERATEGFRELAVWSFRVDLGAFDRLTAFWSRMDPECQSGIVE